MRERRCDPPRTENTHTHTHTPNTLMHTHAHTHAANISFGLQLQKKKDIFGGTGKHLKLQIRFTCGFCVSSFFFSPPR